MRCRQPGGFLEGRERAAKPNREVAAIPRVAALVADALEVRDSFLSTCSLNLRRLTGRFSSAESTVSADMAWPVRKYVSVPCDFAA